MIDAEKTINDWNVVLRRMKLTSKQITTCSKRDPKTWKPDNKMIYQKELREAVMGI